MIRRKYHYFVLLTWLLLAVSVNAQTVHYTKTGKKYHMEGCQYLRKSDYTCTLEEALRMGFEACLRCKPPTKVSKPKAALRQKKKQKGKMINQY